MPARLAPLPLALLFAAGCQPPPGPPAVGTGPVRAVATTSIIADAVRIVGGGHVIVTALMPPGTDPHNYVAQSRDAEAMNEANVVFYHGLHLEGKITALLEAPNAGRRNASVSSAIPADRLRRLDGEAAVDPHVWFDVKLWANCVETIRIVLTDLDKAHAADYQANAARYLAELDALDAEVRQKALALPGKRRVLVTSHDAFGYFARAYGFTVKGLQGVSTSFQTGSQDIDDLVRFIAENDVPAIFCETSVPTRGLESVLAGVRRAKGREVKLVNDADALYSDSLGSPGTPGETYVGMVRHNVDTIVKHLAPGKP